MKTLSCLPEEVIEMEIIFRLSFLDSYNLLQSCRLFYEMRNNKYVMKHLINSFLYGDVMRIRKQLPGINKGTVFKDSKGIFGPPQYAKMSGFSQYYNLEKKNRANLPSKLVNTQDLPEEVIKEKVPFHDLERKIREVQSTKFKSLPPKKMERIARYRGLSVNELETKELERFEEIKEECIRNLKQMNASPPYYIIGPHLIDTPQRLPKKYKKKYSELRRKYEERGYQYDPDDICGEIVWTFTYERLLEIIVMGQDYIKDNLREIIYCWGNNMRYDIDKSYRIIPTLKNGFSFEDIEKLDYEFSRESCPHCYNKHCTYSKYKHRSRESEYYKRKYCSFYGIADYNGLDWRYYCSDCDRYCDKGECLDCAQCEKIFAMKEDIIGSNRYHIINRNLNFEDNWFTTQNENTTGFNSFMIEKNI